MTLPIDSILCGRNEHVLATFPDACIDLTVTSPPYDNLRTYKGFEWDFNATAQQLYRVTKHGGVVVWVVADATIDGSETGTSFRQALRFMEIGFKLHDTMIYQKNSSTFPARETDTRYTSIFEYMFILSKGSIKTHNLICDKKNKWSGHSSYDGLVAEVKEYSPRTNVWQYVTSFNDRTEHTAPFPEKLAEDHILSWSNPGDIVLDPFIGSGTTAKMAIKHHRHFIGIDISEEYCDLARRRIANVQSTLL